MPYSLDSLLNRIWWLIVSKAADISIMISAVNRRVARIWKRGGLF